MRPISFKIPSNEGEGEIIDFHLTGQSVVFLGANGSGKSRLAAWISGQNGQIRISAQRIAAIPTVIEAQARDGALDVRFADFKSKSGLLDAGFDPLVTLLESLFSDYKREWIKYGFQSKLPAAKASHPYTKLDRIIGVWNGFFPDKSISVEEKQLKVFYKKNTAEGFFFGTHLSDGERGMFYLLAEIILLPDDSVVVVDEPDLHLHHSLMVTFWDAIESLRPDCIFLYFTHNQNFAESRVLSQLVVVSGFDTRPHWRELGEICEIDRSLSLELLGARREVLFIEGDDNVSLDSFLYRIAYPTFHIKALGSCGQVIQAVKSFSQHQEYHNNAAFGIIDRDNRPVAGIASLAKIGVHVLAFAHIENFFLCEDFLRVASRVLNLDPDSVVARARRLFFKELSAKKESLASSIATGIIWDSLRRFPGEDAESSLSDIKLLDYVAIKEAECREIERIVELADYSSALYCVKNKGFLRMCLSEFGLDKGKRYEGLKRLVENNSPQFEEVFRRHLPLLRPSQRGQVDHR